MAKVNRWYASISDAINIPNEKNRLSSLIIEDKEMQVRYYSPKIKDNQVPHIQDEVYIIAKGSGTCIRDNEKILFNTGDVIFVPKKKYHYFKDFTEDFATWVIFYGPSN